ncbi:MAG: hypothetical protein R3F19_26225 [Verrucomicrobiales bacterium]
MQYPILEVEGEKEKQGTWTITGVYSRNSKWQSWGRLQIYRLEEV